MIKHSDILEKLTLKEKIALCSGKDYWHSVGIERLGLPSVMLTDGPHGIRKQGASGSSEMKDILAGVPSTCFPPACATAASWDTDLLTEMGDTLGEECLQEKVSVILGPGANIKRSPLCGRNFEYFSEDPYLAGRMATSLIKGIQGCGVGTSMKHFACNNQESHRLTSDSVVDERTLREIYLPAFETAVKEAQPWTIMDSYNRLNGTYTSEHKWLLTDVLRNEWGFDGLIVTDWGAANKRTDGIKAGCDLEMPGSYGYNGKKLFEAVENGELAEEDIDICADRVIDMILKSKKTLCEYRYDIDKHHEIARKIASQCIVLLKNDEDILPLKANTKVALIGEMARSPRYQGAGSSLINPNKLDNAFDEFLARDVNIIYTPGYNKKTDVPDYRLISDAVTAAKSADVALVFAGLTDSYESEGFDRTTLSLPTNHDALITAVANANPNTVVVLSGGSPVLMPWLDKVKAVVNGYLLGQAGGSAMVDVLTGKVNPSGKLPETYPLSLDCVPSMKNFPGTRKTVEYREGIYVGYRYFDTFDKDVLFPFGHGLSYTKFKYSAIKTSKKKIRDCDTVNVTFKVKNVGDVAGAEVCQVYVSDLDSTIYRPTKELKGFVKVYLEPDEEKEVSVTLDKRAFAFWNVNVGDWTVESGEFEILVGSSSRDIRLKTKLTVTSEVMDIPDYSKSAPEYYSGELFNISDTSFETVLGRPIPEKFRDNSQPLQVSNNLEDADYTRNGAAINNLIKRVLGFVGKLNIGGTGDMLAAMALEMPIRNFITMSAGVFTDEMADGLMQILSDGNIPTGLAKIIIGLIKDGLKNVGNLKGMV